MRETLGEGFQLGVVIERLERIVRQQEDILSAQRGLLSAFEGSPPDHHPRDCAQHHQQIEQPPLQKSAQRPPADVVSACAYGYPRATYSVTFDSQNACADYANRRSFGGMSSTQGYSNCSVSTYCFTSSSQLTVNNLQGFNVQGVSAGCIGKLSMAYESEAMCKKGVQNTRWIGATDGSGKCNSEGHVSWTQSGRTNTRLQVWVVAPGTSPGRLKLHGFGGTSQTCRT